MKIKIGVMGSAADLSTLSTGKELRAKALTLAQAIASHRMILLTGATTGLIYEVGKAARGAGVFHIGISPGSSEEEHLKRYQLPTDACDAIVHTGFGLKGRNVVLVRTCDIAVFVSGGMGSLNEFTIAYDEGKIIGCLLGTGGVADEAMYLVEKFANKDRARVFANSNAEELVNQCLAALNGKT